MVYEVMSPGPTSSASALVMNFATAGPSQSGIIFIRVFEGVVLFAVFANLIRQIWLFVPQRFQVEHS